MDRDLRIQDALQQALHLHTGGNCPPRLAQAVHYAVFPGGHRMRPRICLAVAAACGEDHAEISTAAATAIEFMHCASLVHDDMPCFDDAATRRGKPSVHTAFGERLALLCGDALIVLAFQTLASGACRFPERLQVLVQVLGRGTGMPNGIVSGQAWECESSVALDHYQRAKTGALFSAATMAGAAAAGVDHEPWSVLGLRLGEAYQVADDILDRHGDPDVLGKPVGRDQALRRPNAVAEQGMAGATERLRRLIREAIASVPHCRGADVLRRQIEQESSQFMQHALSRPAAA